MALGLGKLQELNSDGANGSQHTYCFGVGWVGPAANHNSILTCTAISYSGLSFEPGGLAMASLC